MPIIENITIGPSLDFSSFSPYTISANISNYPTNSPVTITLSNISGESQPYWNYYIDGSPFSDNQTYYMSYLSGTTWQKTSIPPDSIYPEIFFAPSSVTFSHQPQTTNIRRNQYHLFHYQNPFQMTGDMNFWVEVNAVPNNINNSTDLQVYLVEKNKTINFFQSNWFSSNDAELVGTVSKLATFHHTHNSNSSHYLVTLTPNSDGTVGSKHLDINGDFWIVLNANTPSAGLGWTLRYQSSDFCNYSNRWYKGEQQNWETEPLEGCPDSHVHMLRRSGAVTDELQVTIGAGSTSVS